MNLPDTPLFRIHGIETERVIGKALEQGGIVQHTKNGSPVLMSFLPQYSEDAAAEVCVHVRDGFIRE